MGWTTKEAQREYNRRYRESHKEELQQRGKLYRQQTKEKRAEYNKKYREEHAEEISKREKEYRIKNRDKRKEYEKIYFAKNVDRLRETGKIRMKLWRKNNPLKNKQTIRIRNIELRKQVWAYKEDKGCVECGEKDPRCLDFHHRDPTTKSFNIAQGLSNKLSFPTLMLEIQKCDLMCRNCHVKLTPRMYQK